MFSLDEMARELYEGRLKAKRDARMWEKEKEDTLEMLFEIRRIQIKTDETRAEIARRQTEIDQLMAQIEQRQTEAEWEAQQELAHRIQLCERLLKQPVTDMDELLQQERQALFTLANRLEQQLIHTP